MSLFLFDDSKLLDFRRPVNFLMLTNVKLKIFTIVAL